MHKSLPDMRCQSAFAHSFGFGPAGRFHFAVLEKLDSSFSNPLVCAVV